MGLEDKHSYIRNPLKNVVSNSVRQTKWGSELVHYDTTRNPFRGNKRCDYLI